MNLLDSTITTVAAPVVRQALHGSAADAQWVVAAYTLPFAVFLILGGRLGDIFGRRRIYVTGVVGFLLFSLVCAAAPTMPLLLTARVAQGTFAALCIPQSIGLIKEMFPGPTVARALSFIGPVMAVTAVAGPVLGGVLTQANFAGLSWRAVFLVNIPLGALVLGSAPLLREARANTRPRLDGIGLALVAVATGALVIPTVNGQGTGWPPWTWFSFALAIVAAATLVLHVRRAARLGRDPIVEPSLFHDHGFAAALATSAFYFAVSTGVVFVAVLFVEDGLRASVIAASVTVLPFAAGLAVASIAAGQVLVPRFGSRLMLVGLCMMGAGLIVALVAGLLTPIGYPAFLPVGLGVAGVGGGLTTVPFFTAALSRIRPEETGSAAGLLNSVQQLGGTVGIAGLGTLYSAIAAPASALAVTFVVAIGGTALAAIAALVMLRVQAHVAATRR